MSHKKEYEFHLLPIAAAVLLACGNAYAEESAEVHELVTPESSMSLGAGSVNNANDAKRFSQYTGLNQKGSVLLDFELVKRDDPTGLWTIINGRNLGLETREFSFSQSRQGDWKYLLDYNEIVRRDPYIIHTGMTGIGTTTPTVNLIATPAMPAAWATANGLAASNGVQGSDVELKLKRTALGVSGEKWITPELQFELSFKNEDKKGARTFGRVGIGSGDMGATPRYSATAVAPNTATAGGWAILLTPEPIDSTTRQLDAKLNLNRDKLALTGGYYGSFYVNNNGNLSPNMGNAGTLNRGPLDTTCTTTSVGPCSTVQQLAASAIALPPDNQAHQLYLSGNYAFTNTTRSNFKLSYTHATQDEAFAAMGLGAGASGQPSLGGVVDTKLAQAGLTMQPMQNLSLNGSVRYEDRADKTPVSVYNTNGITGNALNNTTNWSSASQTRTSAKLDGIYRFASGYSFMLGGDWEHKTIPLPPSNTALFANQVLFRSALIEQGIHTELRKALSETLNGAIGFEYKQRRGQGDWFTTSGSTALNPPNALVVFNPAGAAGNRVLPDMYMDKNRTKVRGNLDWEATERLSVQTVLEHAQDKYLRDFSQSLAAPTQVVPTIPGARSVVSDSLSLDTTYQVAETWRINGYWTYSYNRWNVNKANLGDDTRNKTHTVGLGVSDKITSRFTVGMDVLMTRDTTTFNNVVSTPVAGQAPGNIAGWNGQTMPGNYLPNINYRTNKLNLHAKYDVDKVSSVQAVFSYQQFKTDDWQWGYNGVPFLYSDNTTVSQPMTQSLKFIGASYLLRF